MLSAAFLRFIFVNVKLKINVKMIKELISKFGKEKVNTLTKYPSILTLHKLGKKNILQNELTTPVDNEKMYATEKIDGTSIRLLFYGNERIVGTRDNLFVYENSDFVNIPKEFFSSIDYVRPFYEKSKWNKRFETDKLTVLFGELYGSNIGKGAKNYGVEKTGFRLFDVAVYNDLSVLDLERDKISKWRERETETGIIYGQNFLTRSEMESQFTDFEFVPLVEFDLGDRSHKVVLDNLKKFIPNTNVALSENAFKKSEGVVLRNESRSKIVKVRFEDYERTLR
jgi:RNA ligase